jgi:hypothetical protein
MVTVVVSVILMLVGLILIYFQVQAVDLIRQVGLPNDLQKTVVQLVGERMVAYAFLLVSPVLLILGSLVRGL